MTRVKLVPSPPYDDRHLHPRVLGFVSYYKLKKKTEIAAEKFDSEVDMIRRAIYTKE